MSEPIRPPQKITPPVAQTYPQDIQQPTFDNTLYTLPTPNKKTIIYTSIAFVASIILPIILLLLSGSVSMFFFYGTQTSYMIAFTVFLMLIGSIGSYLIRKVEAKKPRTEDVYNYIMKRPKVYMWLMFFALGQTVILILQVLYGFTGFMLFMLAYSLLNQTISLLFLIVVVQFIRHIWSYAGQNAHFAAKEAAKQASMAITKKIFK